MLLVVVVIAAGGAYYYMESSAVKAQVRFVQLGQIVERDHPASPLRLGDPSV